MAKCRNSLILESLAPFMGTSSYHRLCRWYLIEKIPLSYIPFSTKKIDPRPSKKGGVGLSQFYLYDRWLNLLKHNLPRFRGRKFKAVTRIESVVLQKRRAQVDSVLPELGGTSDRPFFHAFDLVKSLVQLDQTSEVGLEHRLFDFKSIHNLLGIFVFFDEGTKFHRVKLGLTGHADSPFFGVVLNNLNTH